MATVAELTKEAASAREERDAAVRELAELRKQFETEQARRAVSKVGARYQALVNLSVPRKNDPAHQCDLIPVGETVILTDEEAAQFMPPVQHTACIRPVADVGQPFPRVLPRLLSGPLRVPPPPPPGSDAERPDPPGSSNIQVLVPEATGPQVDFGADISSQQFPEARSVDAVDLPPGARTR